MKRLLLGASAVIALSAGHAVRADDDYHFHDGNKNPAISYVRNSLAQSVILNGAGKLAVNHGFSLMQPYYFPFVRRHGRAIG